MVIACWLKNLLFVLDREKILCYIFVNDNGDE